MDGHYVDTLARDVAATRSRRQLLHALAATTVASVAVRLGGGDGAAGGQDQAETAGAEPGDRAAARDGSEGMGHRHLHSHHA